MINPCVNICNKQTMDECDCECEFSQAVQENKRLREYMRLAKQQISSLELEKSRDRNVATFTNIFRD